MSNADTDKYITYLMAVYRYYWQATSFLVLDAGYCGQVIADKSQDGIPKDCNQSGVQQEVPSNCVTKRQGWIYTGKKQVSRGQQRLIRFLLVQKFYSIYN
jgi:hypothetical protein